MDTFIDEPEYQQALIRWMKVPGSPGPSSRATRADLPAVPGYEVLGELGRGGMGVVYKARHLRLDRLVALKMMRTRGPAESEELDRFRTEAEAAARLQHPHIVQIYDVGQLDDRPYFTMELVEGGSLAEKLDGTPQPARQAAQLLEVVARAVHFAHQQHVVHRDLKPANVLLAADGTPKVADFGLAKRLELGADLTRTGVVLGTPSYMAPEQAAGRVTDVGPAADVYGLGAILYKLLTGRPPFVGETAADTLHQVQTEEPVPPRRLQPKAPHDLDTICMKCLQKDPPKRYASAEALADDLRRWLNGEPIRARAVGPVERLGRWCRRKPAVAGLLAGLPAVLLVGFVGVLVMRLRAEAHAADARGQRAEVERQWLRAEGEAAEARRQQVEADQQRQEAEDNFRLVLRTVEDYLTKVAESPELKAHGLEELRRDLLLAAKEYYDKFVQQRGDQPGLQAELGRAYFRLAMITDLLGSKEEAIGLYKQAVGRFERLPRGHPEDAEYQSDLAKSYHNLGLVYYIANRWADAEAAYLQDLAIGERLARAYPKDPKVQEDLAKSHHSLGLLFKDTGREADAESAFQKALVIFERLARDHRTVPLYQQDLASCSGNLANLYHATGRSAEAEAAYQQAFTIFERLAREEPAVPQHQQGLAASHYNLGRFYYTTGRRAKAEEAFKEALTIRERLAREHPKVPTYQQDLATLLSDPYRATGGLAEGEAAFKQALAIFQPLAHKHVNVAAYQRDLAACHNRLGAIYFTTGRRAEAEEAFKEAFTIRERLACEHPNVPTDQQDLATSHNNLGELYRATNRPAEAEAACKEARAIYEQLARDHRIVPRYQEGLAASHSILGELYRATKRLAEAEAACKEALAIRERLAHEHPKVLKYQNDLAASHDTLGNVHRAAGRLAEAEAAFKQALAIREPLVRDHPDALGYAINLGGTYCNRGHLERDSSRPAEALDCYAKAIHTLEAVLQRERQEANARLFLRNAHLGRAFALTQLNRHPEALEDWDRTIELDTGPARDSFRLGRALTLARLGQHRRAIAEADELRQDKTASARYLYELACVYALSATAARQEAELPTADAYAARAVELLNQARTAGYFKDSAQVEQLKKDGDLDPLRSREDFKKLSSLLEGESKSGPGSPPG